MKRREFLITAAGAAALAGTGRLWAAQAPNATLARVAVASRNFDAMIKMGHGAPAAAARTLDFLDFAQMIADKFGVHNLDVQHAHFMSTEPAYLQDVKDRVARAKSQIVQINTEFFNTNASSNNTAMRGQAVDLAKQWIDHAKVLGCPRVQVNAGHLSDNVRAAAIDVLTRTAAYAKAGNVTVSIENMDNGAAPAPPPPPAAPAAPVPPAAAGEGARAGDAGRAGGGGRRAGGGGGGAAPAGGGRASTPPRPASWQVIAEVAKASGVAVTPNFLGFPSESERAAGLKVLFPMANGNSHVAMIPGKVDLASGIKIAQDAGYRGLFTIVTEGGDPAAATKATLDELLKLI